MAVPSRPTDNIFICSPFRAVPADPGTACKVYKTFSDMKSNVFAPLAGLACIVAVVVVSCFLFGGYGAILAGVAVAVGLADCSGCCDPGEPQE